MEKLIKDLSVLADAKPNMYKKPLKTGQSYRTLWSTVTASSPLGWLLQQKPSVVLGGPSWQTISSDGKSTENVVNWIVGDNSIRMIGLADLQPLKDGKNGYDLMIRGLEFRVGSSRKGISNDQVEQVPEKKGAMGSQSGDKFTFGPFLLKDDEALRNGVGTLEVLYNDGFTRITEDKVQKNKYIHIVEDYSELVLSINSEMRSRSTSSTKVSDQESLQMTNSNSITKNSNKNNKNNNIGGNEPPKPPINDSGLGPWLQKTIGEKGMKVLGLVSITPYILFFFKFLMQN